MLGCALAENLTYTYGGNRLTGVWGAAGAARRWDSGTLSDMLYDPGGNLVSYYDASRGVYDDRWYDEETFVMSYRPF